jgi:hypothetical protein
MEAWTRPTESATVLSVEMSIAGKALGLYFRHWASARILNLHIIVAWKQSEMRRFRLLAHCRRLRQSLFSAAGATILPSCPHAGNFDLGLVLTSVLHLPVFCPCSFAPLYQGHEGSTELVGSGRQCWIDDWYPPWLMMAWVSTENLGGITNAVISRTIKLLLPCYDAPARAKSPSTSSGPWLQRKDANLAPTAGRRPNFCRTEPTARDLTSVHGVGL